MKPLGGVIAETYVIPTPTRYVTKSSRTCGRPLNDLLVVYFSSIANIFLPVGFHGFASSDCLWDTKLR